MKNSELRIDPVTNVKSSFFNAEGKPRATNPRTLPPENKSSCPFCVMANQIKEGKTLVAVDGVARPVLTSSKDAFVVPNRWSAFGSPPDGFAELALPMGHIVEPSDFSRDEWVQCMTLAYERYCQNRATFENVYVSLNFGMEAGSSMAHCHFHIVGSQGSSVSHMNESSLKEDLQEATKQRLVFDGGLFGTHIYVPYAPAFDGEIRIKASGANNLIESLYDAVVMIDKVKVVWAYNILIYFDYNFAHVCFRPKPMGVLDAITNRRTFSVDPFMFFHMLNGHKS